MSDPVPPPAAGARPNVVLVGFMGTGKTTVGRLLARRLQVPFQDTDRWIVRRAGKPISSIFAEDGEPAFRGLETEAAREFSSPQGLVLSTGGGMLGRDENVRLLRQGGVIICLTARPGVIAERTRPWKGRPLLQGVENPLEVIERMLRERAPRYALADYQLDTSELTLKQVVERLCDVLPSLYPIASTRS